MLADKGSTRFAPKVKPRNSRAPADSAKASNASAKATPTPKPVENVSESQNDLKEKSTPSTVSASTTAPAADAAPPAIASSAPPDVTASVVPAVKKAASDIAKKTLEEKSTEKESSIKDSAPKSAAKEPVRQLRTRAPDADITEKEATSNQLEEPKKDQSATSRRVSRPKGKEKATEQELEPALTKAQTPKLAFKGQDRAVRAGSRAQVQRSKENKGKEKEIDPMSRAVKATDGWTPINAKRKAAVAAEQKAVKATTSKPAAKKAAKVTATATKTTTAAAPKKKATAKSTAKALEKKKTGVKKLFATDDEPEASTSTTAAKANAKRAVRKPVKRKQAIIPLKKRKIPKIHLVPKVKVEKSPPPPLITLQDFHGDPMTDDILDRPMGDFVKDEKKGVVSKIFKEFEEARLKKRKRDEETGKTTASTSQTAEISPDIPTQPEKKKKEEDGNVSLGDVSLQESSHAVQFKLVNGEMQIDTESLAIRRSAMAPLITENMEIVEETSMSKMVNSQTYGKKSRSQRWTDDETKQFYNALSQWGTDFEMIARLFPHRNRRQVKLKFSREERVNPDKVTEYIIRKNKPIDLDHYKSITGRNFDDEMKNMDVDFNNMVTEKLEEEAKLETSLTADNTEQSEATVPTNNGPGEEEVLGYVDT
ncbi:hypothetical protein NQZ79_g4961 [Umbelopsis isabellina]|nr:hypothetical protein NQZ79_g4961 [Umbelopsis isabellina]